MQIKSIPWVLWLVPIALLFIAIERMPYGYYTFTRIIVCGFAAFSAYRAWRDEAETTASISWAVILGLVAALFNPIIPVYLKRGTWEYIDVGAALIFAAHLMLVRLGWLQHKRA